MNLGEKSLGSNWNNEIAALNTLAPVVLRANTLKTNAKNLRVILAQEDIDTIIPDGYSDALQLVERKNVFTTQAFKSGFFEVQDASSQKVAQYLDISPGMKIADMCAGAGGKTLHIAAIMKNRGQIIAMDIYEGKLKELKKKSKTSWSI